jgi:hypothetical protein
MTKKILLIITMSITLNAAMITGSDSKISISGASMNVTSGGVTKTVNSGQITFTEEGSAPTDARKLKPNDLKDITDELVMSDYKRLINLKYPPVKNIIAKKIRAFLLKVGINKSRFSMNSVKGKTAIYIKQIDINQIKEIYPLYYKALSTYYLNNNAELTKKSNTPTVKIKLSLMKKYHKSIFNKYR